MNSAFITFRCSRHFLSFSSSSLMFCSMRFSAQEEGDGGGVNIVAATPATPPPGEGASPAECRTVRSLRCGPATSDRDCPAAHPESGGFCARRPYVRHVLHLLLGTSPGGTPLPAPCSHRSVARSPSTMPRSTVVHSAIERAATIDKKALSHKHCLRLPATLSGCGGCGWLLDSVVVVVVVVWWCGGHQPGGEPGVVVWWCGGVVVWWCGGVVVWW